MSNYRSHGESCRTKAQRVGLDWLFSYPFTPTASPQLNRHFSQHTTPEDFNTHKFSADIDVYTPEQSGKDQQEQKVLASQPHPDTWMGHDWLQQPSPPYYDAKFPLDNESYIAKASKPFADPSTMSIPRQSPAYLSNAAQSRTRHSSEPVTSRLNAVPQGRLREQNRLLFHLRDERQMSWKAITHEFQELFGRQYKQPALQMRYGRMKSTQRPSKGEGIASRSQQNRHDLLRRNTVNSPILKNTFGDYSLEPVWPDVGDFGISPSRSSSDASAITVPWTSSKGRTVRPSLTIDIPR